MKSTFINLLLATIGIFQLLSCKNNANVNALEYYSDTSKFYIDSIYKNVDLQGKKISIWVLRDNKDSSNRRYCRNCDEWSIESIYSSPVTTLFVSEEGNILLKRHFDSYVPYFFKPSGKRLDATGKLLMVRNFGAGGSGYREQISYVFNQNGNPEINDIFEMGELDFLIFNKDEKSFVLMQGFWNMDAEEAHFDDHVLELLKYTFNTQNFVDGTNLGRTKNKYPCPEDGYAFQVLGEILKYEPYYETEVGVVWSYYKN